MASWQVRNITLPFVTIPGEHCKGYLHDIAQVDHAQLSIASVPIKHAICGNRLGCHHQVLHVEGGLEQRPQKP
jgi:hypothetical protein